MQISNGFNISHQAPSFGSLTRVFKNKFFAEADTYQRIIDSATTKPYIGTLPKEIIDAICKIAKSKEEKGVIIKKILTAFSQAAQALTGVHQGISTIEIFKAQKGKQYIPQQRKAAGKASKILTSAFKETGLLKKGEKITVTRFNKNEGMHGVVFNISFPKTTHWTKKVIKIFKDIRGIPGNNLLLGVHNLGAEANSALFIQKQQACNYKKSVFVQPYLGSLKDRFMLLEHAGNYEPQPSDKFRFKRFFENKNITCEDISPTSETNIVNGRIIDYGGIYKEYDTLTKSAFKILLNLKKAEIKSINIGNDKPLIDALIKYVKGSQKETKASVFDRERAVFVFMSNTAFSEETKNILVKLKLFKPEQISTY